MRPIDEVLAAGRKYHEHSHAGEPDIRWLPLRRELEEWEKQLVHEKSRGAANASDTLAEVRHLLGRGEPEPATLEPKSETKCRYRDCTRPWFTKIGDQQLCIEHCSTVMQQISRREHFCVDACHGVPTDELKPGMLAILQARVVELESDLDDAEEVSLSSAAEMSRLYDLVAELEKREEDRRLEWRANEP